MKCCIEVDPNIELGEGTDREALFVNIPHS
jgi:hypothetical protein